MELKDDKKDILSCSTPVERLFPALVDGATIVVAVNPVDYAASAIARAVEDVDAHLVNLNVSADRSDNDELLVHLRVDRRNGMAVSRSLERYGFRVVEMEAADAGDAYDADESTRERISALLRYLDV